MTEREILERAKGYIDKMANGIDPLTDQPVPDADLINQVRISRCLFYVSKVLGEVLEKGIADEPRPAPRRNKPFAFPEGLRDTYILFDEPMAASMIVGRINERCAQADMVQLKSTTVFQWLTEIGFLQTVSAGEGKTKRVPTQKGLEQGLSRTTRMGQNGPYEVILYDRHAQQFILDNIDAIAALQSSKNENDGQPWTVEHDALLRELWAKGTSFRDMAAALKRRPGAIRARIQKLGLLPQNG